MRHRRPTAPSVTSRPLASLALLALLTALPITGFPANGGRASSYADPENEDNRPIEKDVELPPFPKSENLIPFFVSTTTTNKFMIDGESLTLDTDDLIRYTLVISSPSGALNTSYEGIRCSTAERRLYATGRSDQTWAKVNTISGYGFTKTRSTVITPRSTKTIFVPSACRYWIRKTFAGRCAGVVTQWPDNTSAVHRPIPHSAQDLN